MVPNILKGTFSATIITTCHCHEKFLTSEE
jgi:hypothetical protein